MNQITRLGMVVMILFIAYQQYVRSERPAAVARLRQEVPSASPGVAEPLGSVPDRQPAASPANSPILRIAVPSVQPGKPMSHFSFTLQTQEKPVLLSELLFFLDRTWKNERTYILDEYDCKHFAYQLYNDAVDQGMAVRFIAMTIRDSPIGHAFNAFMTSDAGIVYVDFTSAVNPKDPSKAMAQKNLVYAAPGEPYIRIPIDRLGIGFKNHRADFFDKLQSGRAFVSKVDAFNEKQKDIHSRRAILERRHSNIQRQPASAQRHAESVQLKADMDDWNGEVERVNREATELQNEQKAWTRNQWVSDDAMWVAEEIRFIPTPFPGAVELSRFAMPSEVSHKTPVLADPQKSIEHPSR